MASVQHEGRGTVGIHWIGGWVGPRVGLDVSEIIWTQTVVLMCHIFVRRPSVMRSEQRPAVTDVSRQAI
jgi:hypothetical protein